MTLDKLETHIAAIDSLTMSELEVAQMMDIAPAYVGRVVEENRYGMAKAKVKVYGRVKYLTAVVIQSQKVRQEALSARRLRKKERDSEDTARAVRREAPTLKELQQEARDLGIPYTGVNKEGLANNIENFQAGEWLPASHSRKLAADARREELNREKKTS